MDERFDVYRGDECLRQGATLREAAELIGIEMIELATTVLEYGSCMIGEFRAVPSNDAPSS
jgi:hypothetical protein